MRSCVGHVNAATARRLRAIGTSLLSVILLVGVAPLAVARASTTTTTDAATTDVAAPTLVARLAGADRYATSAAISASTFAPGVPVVYVDNGTDWPDALAAGPVAARAGGPILLTPATTIPGSVAAELTRLKPARIVALGDATETTAALLHALASYAPVVTRLGTRDPAASSAAISASAFAPGVPVVFVDNSTDWPDGLSAGPVAARAGGPILYTTATTIPAVTAAELTRLHPAQIIALGSSSVTSAALLTLLGQYAPAVARIGGADRYATSAALSASSFAPGTPVVYLDSGTDWPDALAAVPVATAAGGPILLVGATSVSAVTRAEVVRLAPAKLIALGGQNVLSEASLYSAAGLAIPAQPIPPLPPCRLADGQTPAQSYTDWNHTLVDWSLMVPRSYAPPDLVAVSRAGTSGSGLIRDLVIPDLAAMTKAAKAAGAPIAVQSAYRSYATQVSTFAHWVATLGYAEAVKGSARPGHSEHQLGTAIDFKSYGGGAPWSFGGYDWATSKAGTWMMKNAYRYGFILSYPKGQQAKVCYSYEPWHYRYVGRGEALAIHSSGLTPREWYWDHPSG